MKTSMAFLFFGYLILSVEGGFEANRVFKDHNVKVLSQAVCRMIETTCQCITVLSTSSTDWRIPSDFVDELFSNCLTNSPKYFLTSRLSYSQHINGTGMPKFCFNIILIERFENQKFSLNSNEGFYLIVLLNGREQDIQKLYDAMWKMQVLNVNVVTANNDRVEVKTFMPFNAKACDDTTPVLINVFKDGSFENNTLFPNKTRNLFGCPINIVSSQEALPFVIAKENNGNYDLKGAEIDLTDTLAKALNFKINYSYTNVSAFILLNGSITGVFRRVLDGDAHLAVGNWWLKINRIRLFDFTNPYANDQIVFLIPPGKDLTSIEKLIFPFTAYAWVLIALAFIVGLVFILVVRLQKNHKVQEAVFGSAKSSPILNMYIAFIGQTQKLLPKSNFAKLMLTTFLLFSLVIRSAYQGSFYLLLQSNLRHKGIQTVDEIIKGNYKIFTTIGNIDILNGTPEFRDRLEKVRSILMKSNDFQFQDFHSQLWRRHDDSE